MSAAATLCLFSPSAAFCEEEGSTSLLKRLAPQIQYLENSHDFFHNGIVDVYDDRDSGGNHYFPSGWMGDLVGLPEPLASRIIDDKCQDRPHSGTSFFRIDVPDHREVPANQNYCAVYWLYPDRNFGEKPGLDMTPYIGKSKRAFAQFAVRAAPRTDVIVEFKVGGVNRDFTEPNGNVIRKDASKASDSMPLCESGPVRLKYAGGCTEIQRSKSGFTGVKAANGWLVCRIPLPDPKKFPNTYSNVLGGFCLSIQRQNPQTKAVQRVALDLDRIRFVFEPDRKDSVDAKVEEAQFEGRMAEARLIRSFTPFNVGKRPPPNKNNDSDDPDYFVKNTGFTYDQALAMMTFVALARAEPNAKRKALYWRRARLIADALAQALLEEKMLRNAYSCGDRYDPSTFKPSQRLPGWWNDESKRWEQDSYSLSSNCGDQAWALLAFISCAEHAQRLGQMNLRDSYIECADILAGSIDREELRAPGVLGGYFGGYEVAAADPLPKRLNWRSAEHAIDIAVAFERLAAAGSRLPKSRLQSGANRARTFLNAMWNPEAKRFATGTTVRSLPEGKSAPSDEIEQVTVPLDVQTWGALSGLEPKYVAALDWAWDHCRTPRYKPQRLAGFDFNDDGDGVWWEGTAQMALALRMAGMKGRAEECARLLSQEASRVSKPEPNEPRWTPDQSGGLFASSVPRLSTGFKKGWGDWVYFHRRHVGATCWYLFSALGYNPYSDRFLDDPTR